MDEMPSVCPTEAELAALLTGELPENERTALEQHFEICATCRQQLDLMAVGDGMWIGAARAYVKAGSSIPAHHVVERLKSNLASTVENKLPLPDPLLVRGEGVRQLGDYEILGELGRGGMGVVFKARQRRLQREVALKVILTGQLASEAQVRRFQIEAEAAARLDHPNIVPIYEIGEHEGRQFFSMKLIEGANLKDRSAEYQALPSRTASRGEMLKRERKLARLLADIARAVHHAHLRGILHRDLKPANILIDAQDSPHLTDFGLAKLAQSGADLTLSRMVMGTPEYMSPEQAAGHTHMITTTSDVYSLGAILYELLTGRPPFAGDDPMRIFNRVSTEEPESPRTVNPSVSRDLEIICLHCLEKEPSRRYRSAEALAEELERFSRGEAIRSRAVTAPERVWRWCRRKPALSGALGAFVVAFVLGFAGVAWKWRGEVHQRRLAEHESRQKREALTRLELERAEAQFQMGNSDKALAYLGRLVRREPSNQVVVERLLNALSYRSFCLPIAPLTHGQPTTAQSAPFRPEPGNPLRLGAGVPITAASFSPDGRLIVTASLDDTARLWESDTGQPLGEPLKHDDAVLWTQFSPDGTKLLATSQDGTVRLWDVRTREPVWTSARFSGAVRHGSFHPDGSKVIIACDDRFARVLEVATGKIVGKTLRHDSRVYYAAFSPDGRAILTAEEHPAAGDAPGHLWDVDTGLETGRFPHRYRPEVRNPFPCFSPSGDQVLIFDEMFNGLVFSSHQTATHSEPENRFHHDGRVTALAFSPDGQWIATGAQDATARIWIATNTTEALHKLLHKQTVSSVQFSPDGTLLLTGSNDRTAQLWNVKDGCLAAEPLRHSYSVLNAVMITNRILTVSEAHIAWLWDVPSGQLPMTMRRGHHTGVECVRFSPDGNMLASRDHQGVCRWDARTGEPVGEPIQPPRGGQQILDIDFSPDGKYLATALEGGSVLLWNPRSTNSQMRPVAPPFRPLRETEPNADIAIHRVRFDPDSRRMVTACGDGTVTVWGVTWGRALCTLRHQGRVNYAEFSPDGKRIVTASWDGTAKVCDAETGSQLFPGLQHDSQVNWARFDPTGTRIVTASRDKTVRIWSARDGTLLHTLVHPDALAESFSFDFAADLGRIYLASIAGDTLRIWDLDTGEPTGVSIRHPAELLSVRFSPDGRRLVTASNDGRAWLWNAKSGEQLSEPLRHRGRVTYAEFSPDGTRIVTGSSVDDAVRLWPVIRAPVPAPAWLPELAEALAGQRILDDERSQVVPVTNLFQLRRRLKADAGSDYFSRWARWFFSDNRSRPASDLFELKQPPDRAEASFR